MQSPRHAPIFTNCLILLLLDERNLWNTASSGHRDSRSRAQSRDRHIRRTGLVQGVRRRRGRGRSAVDICLDDGLTMFDSADAYSAGMAEEILGQAIKGAATR